MNKASGSYLDKELLDPQIDPGASDVELRIIRKMLLALRRGILWLLLVPLCTGLIVFFLSGFSATKYTSVAQVMIETRENVETEFAPVVSGLPTSSTTLESELEVLRSLDLVERLVDEFDLVNDPEFMPDTEEDVTPGNDDGVNIQREKAIASVAERRSIEQVGTVSAVYAISFTTSDPVKSASLANALAQEYLETTTSAKLRSLELSQGWLAERTTELQARLTDLGVEREKQIMSAPNSPEEVETIKAKSLSVERRLREAQQELLRENSTLLRVGVLLSLGKPEEAALALEDSSSQLKPALDAFNAGDPNAPAAFRQALDRVLEDRTEKRERLAGEIRVHEQELALLFDILADQATHDAELNRIENDILIAQAIYQDFVAQLSRRTEQERYLDADARIISSARPALNPSEPNRSAMAGVSTALAFVATMLFLIGAELRHTGLRTVREFEDVTGLPLIGVLPAADEHELPVNLALEGPQSISPRMMRHARKLRASVIANLRNGQSRNDLESRIGTDYSAKTIAGVSTNPDEGLSASILLLAAACVEAGEKVLILDLDFWNSRFAEMYGVTPDKVRLLLSAKSKTPVVSPKKWPGLSVLAIKNRNESEPAPFTDEEIAQIIERLEDSFDRILVDTAPTMQRIDAASFSRVADAILYILQWNKTTSGDLKSALKLMNDVGVQPTAVIATQVDTKQLRGFGERALSYKD